MKDVIDPVIVVGFVDVSNTSYDSPQKSDDVPS